MRFSFATCGIAVTLWPMPLWAHDAFGDLGPLYQALLHPLVDPVQGLLVVSAAVLLARQPLPAVRIAYPAFAFAAFAAVLAATVFALGGLSPRVLAVIVAIIGLLAATGLRLGTVLTAVIVAAVGLAAGSLVDPAQDLHGALLSVVGGALGLSIAALCVWGVVDLAGRRISPVAGAMLGGWVAAVGLMLTAMPV